MPRKVFYSVVIPGHNESKSIPRLIESVRQQLNNLGKPFEIIFVNDNSSDNSEQILSNTQKKFPELVVVNRHNNPGVGNAQREGFSKARGEILITLDGDFSHNPEQIPSLLNALKDSDMVCGSRYLGQSRQEHKMSVSRKTISRLFNITIGSIIGLPIKDFTSGFRVIRKKVIDGIDLESNGFGIYIEIPIKAHLNNFRIVEAPITYEKAESASNLGYLRQGREYFKVVLFALRSKLAKFLR